MSRAITSSEGMGSVARGGAFAFLGSVVSAVMGLLLVVVLGRTLGTEGAGVVFQGIAAFTIALSLAKFGLDTTAVWLLPRLRAEAPGQLRAAAIGLLVPALGVGLLGAAALLVLSRVVDEQERLADSLVAMSWALPLAAVAMVALAATRALGGVRTFVTVQNIFVPTARPLLAWMVTLAGGSAVAVAVSWVAPFPVAALVAVVILVSQLRRVDRHRARDSTSPWVTTGLTHRIWGYTLPRAVSAILEESMRWLDVLLVGLLAGPAAAGLYGAATRFTNAGMIVSTSLRIVVAPMYSRHLGKGDVRAANDLYTVTTIWIIAFSVPLYVVLTLFGGSMIGLLGQDFRDGSLALSILAVGMAMVLTAGNIQSVLLMSGHSSLAALNKVAAVTVNVLLLLALVPPFGIVGAAVAWVLAMAVDTVLALVQVRHKVGLRPLQGGVVAILLTVIVTFGVPAAILRASLGDTVTAMVAASVLGASCLLVALWRGRQKFHLAGLATMLTARKGN
ncbi:polysaccharide biosynthesis C-terminal domain-containing protein [Serinicoccus chungangensis]|uniref:oligosaccharide flippase family protein n=1 Tax=Serinicoccus chungangensis TaxID=767452 RepID=UPI00111AACD8|nr:polysaccharide biosynthesis C-terminal domain-containing protein [Serinicoccus chungangensis]